MRKPDKTYVSSPGWCVSYRSTTIAGWDASYLSGGRSIHIREPEITLGVFRSFKFPERIGTQDYTKHLHGWGDGKKFATREKATWWAYEHGYLMEYRTAWCPHCRVEHFFYGKRTGHCPVTNTFT